MNAPLDFLVQGSEKFYVHIGFRQLKQYIVN